MKKECECPKKNDVRDKEDRLLYRVCGLCGAKWYPYIVGRKHHYEKGLING